MKMDSNKYTFEDVALSKYLAAIFIAAIVFIVYMNSFGNLFLFDDDYLITKNTVIQSFKNIPAIFQHHLYYFTGSEGGFYRPLQSLTLVFDYFFWGLDPLGYHITNTLLHALAGIFVFIMIRALTKNNLLSIIVSIFYAVHPVHTEAVAYISGRADSLAAIFLLVMLIFQYKYWSLEKSYSRLLCYAAILLFFSLALLSKELSLIFPFLLALNEYCNRDKEGYRFRGRAVLFYLPLFILAGAWFVLKNSIAPTEAMSEDEFSLKTSLIMVPRLIINYIRISLFPVNLHMEYKFPFPQSVLQNGYAGPFLLIFIFIALVLYVWKKGKTDINYRLMFFGLAWFVVALIPFLNIFFPVNAPFAEHWLYVPEIGFALFIVYTVFYSVRKSRSAKKWGTIIFSCIIAAYCLLTIKQNTIWRDPAVFFTYTIEHSPYSAKAYKLLSDEYIKKGDLSKAKKLLERALELEPGYSDAAENLRILKLDLQRRNIAPD